MRPYFSASSSPLPRTDRLAALTSAWARTCTSAGLAASDGAGREIGGGRMRARVGSRPIGGSIGVGAIAGIGALVVGSIDARSEEHTSELQSLMRISYAVL